MDPMAHMMANMDDVMDNVMDNRFRNPFHRAVIVHLQGFALEGFGFSGSEVETSSS